MSDAARLTGEASNRKIAAVFGGPAEAQRAAQALRAALSLGQAQVQVIAPDEPHPGRKLEPESRGIWHTIVRAISSWAWAARSQGWCCSQRSWPRACPSW